MSQFCPHCGAQVNDGSNFCPSCGKSLNQQQQNVPVPTTDNTKLITGILAILLGGLGIHYFYLGKTQAGIIALVLGLCTCGIWALIAFIQGILILLMSDEEFRMKYINTDKSFPLF